MSTEQCHLTVEAEVAKLETRASGAEKQLAALKAQLGSADATAVGGADLKDRLSTLLRLLFEDREECETVRAQRDELREENARLRALVDKREYRIKHLLRTIDEIEKSEVAQ